MMQRRESDLRITIILLAGLLVLPLASLALAQADKSKELTAARDEYKAAVAKANEPLLAKHAQKEWAAAKAKADEAEAKAKAGDVKSAVDIYKQATKAAKDAIDLAAYAEASKAATAVADAKKAKENFEKSKPIVAKLETEKDLYTARDLLAELDELIPSDPRMPAFRQKVKALPIPKETVIRVGRRLAAIKLIQIPAGTFMMGAPEQEQGRAFDEGPQREVTISKPFYMSIHEITQDQWDQCLGDRPSGKPPEIPVTGISKEDALRFCTAASDAKAKREVRLPTEAEWEYACRAGGKARFHFGDSVAALADHAWCSTNSDSKPHPGGAKKPNAFGLYDMHGNVWEWCSDIYAPEYPSGKAADPQGPPGGWSHIARGGSWRCDPLLARSAYRYIVPPSFTCDDIGLRIVVTWNLD